MSKTKDKKCREGVKVPPKKIRYLSREWKLECFPLIICSGHTQAMMILIERFENTARLRDGVQGFDVIIRTRLTLIFLYDR